MRDVLADLLEVWDAGGTGGRRHRRADVLLGSPAARRVDGGGT